MPSPFPGMDPYLENPRFFPDSTSLIIFASRTTCSADCLERITHSPASACGWRSRNVMSSRMST